MKQDELQSFKKGEKKSKLISASIIGGELATDAKILIRMHLSTNENRARHWNERN